MRSLASDNNSGVHPLVIEALIKANQDHAVGYGNDPWTREATEKIKETFSTDCAPFFTFNGTGSNTVALQLITRPYQSVLCSDTAHIYVDECGAPTKATGCPLVTIPSPDGKLNPESIAHHLHGIGDQHHSQPGAIYLSESTEFGTVYTPDELRAITAFAHKNGLYVHMDGARLANAAAALGLSLKALTADCGIDVLSFGGTKNGLMIGECVIVFHPELIEAARFVRKQTAQLASKMRYLSCQFTAYLTDGLWLRNATHANRMAQLLYEGLKEVPSIHFTQRVESNELFFTMPRPVIDRLLQHFFFYVFNEETNEVRLVTSFDTTENDISTFLATLKAI